MYSETRSLERGGGETEEAPVTIRPMRFSDIPTVVYWERKIFPSPWSPENFLAELENPRVSIAVVMECGGEFAGYAMAWAVADELHITNLAVVPSFRRRGIAEKAMEYLLQLGRQRGCRYAQLEVRVSNTGAIRLYEKLGFAKLGIRKKYYFREGEDAFVMGREL
jgi:ribosomal-protein-alanine N-acetyltransferase